MRQTQSKRLRRLTNASASPKADPRVQRARYQSLKRDFKKIPGPYRAGFLRTLDKAVAITREAHGELTSTVADFASVQPLST